MHSEASDVPAGVCEGFVVSNTLDSILVNGQMESSHADYNADAATPSSLQDIPAPDQPSTRTVPRSLLHGRSFTSGV